MFDDLSCTLYDIFVYELFCSKENINTVIATESQGDIYSNYDGNNKKKVVFRHSLIYCLGSFVISKHSFVANEDSGWLIFFSFLIQI